MGRPRCDCPPPAPAVTVLPPPSTSERFNVSHRFNQHSPLQSQRITRPLQVAIHLFLQSAKSQNFDFVEYRVNLLLGLIVGPPETPDKRYFRRTELCHISVDTSSRSCRLDTYLSSVVEVFHFWISRTQSEANGAARKPFLTDP